MSKPRLLICPYCGDTQPERERCRACGGIFEPLSRQATHNAMGPWFIRDEQRPFQPGCSYDTILKLIQRGRVNRLTIVRGPTTRQFWTVAKRVPGLSHHFGFCHQCSASVDREDNACHTCGATFGAYLDRNYLGLPEYRRLPWEERSEERGAESELGEPSDWRQAPPSTGGPRGISSFATDEELLGTEDLLPPGDAPAPGRAEHHGAATTPPAGRGNGKGPAPAAAPVQTVEPAPPSEPRVVSQTLSPSAQSSEPAPGEMTVRSLRRQLLRQRQLSRRLAIGFVLAAALAALLALLWFDARMSGSGLETSPESMSTSTGTPRAETAPESRTPVDDAAEDDLLPELEDPLDVFFAEDDPAQSAAAPPMSRETVMEMYNEAVGLMEQAGDRSRNLSKRIADYERALSLLEEIQQRADDETYPEGLAERISSARRELERLRLREFFP